MASTSTKTATKVVETLSTPSQKTTDEASKTSIKYLVPEGRFKLYYFPGNGRGFAPRVALAVAGFDFEDVRMSFDEMKELRKGKEGVEYNEKVPLGQFPILVLPDGKSVITQSVAIVRFAGKYSELYPADPIKALIVDEVMDAANEFDTIIPISQNAEEKKRLRELFVKEKLPKYFDLFAKKLQQSGGPFVLGENLSVADLVLFGVVDTISIGFYDHIPFEVIQPWRTVVEHLEHVRNHPVVVRSKAIKA